MRCNEGCRLMRCNDGRGINEYKCDVNKRLPIKSEVSMRGNEIRVVDLIIVQDIQSNQ